MKTESKQEADLNSNDSKDGEDDDGDANDSDDSENSLFDKAKKPKPKDVKKDEQPVKSEAG